MNGKDFSKRVGGLLTRDFFRRTFKHLKPSIINSMPIACRENDIVIINPDGTRVGVEAVKWTSDGDSVTPHIAIYAAKA